MDLKLQSAPKQRRTQKKSRANRDIISSLPDEILIHILSFCSTKDAAKTSVLSRKWRYTWVSIPSLDFDDRQLHQYSAVNANLFANSVKRVLQLRHETIKSFVLRVGNPHLRSKAINQLISAVIRHNVEEFKLDCGSSALRRSKSCGIVLLPGSTCMVQLPRSLYSCQTIKNLTLDGAIRLNDPKSFSFPNLKILTLVELLDLDGDSIENIIKFSPVLEELSIAMHCAEKMKNLSIQSSSLKSLTIEKWDRESTYYDDDHDLYTVTIDTPNLEIFHFSHWGFDDYSIKTLSSLSKAFISICLEWGGHTQADVDKLHHILSQISSAKHLTLSEWTMQYLNVLFLPFPEDFPYFYSLTDLKMEVAGKKWLLVPHILEHTPNLRVLVVQTVENDDYDEEELTLSFEELPSLLASLERLEMQDFVENTEEMKFLEYMLKHGTSLNAVIITCFYRFNKLDILKKLAAYPKASRTCQVSFS